MGAAYKYEIWGRLHDRTLKQIIRDKVQQQDEFIYKPYYTPNHIIKYALDNGIPPGDYLPEYDAFYSKALTFIKTDNHHRFELLILDTDPAFIDHFPPFGLLEDLCKHNAVACATAFLRYYHLDLYSFRFEDTRYSPFDYAALHSSPALTRLLLHYGAKPDHWSREHGFPLDTALDNLCRNEYVKQWTKDRSIYKLLYILCLPELKDTLETIKLLASYTGSVDQIYADLIDYGDIPKLAALMMAAKDQLLAPSAEGGLETTPIGKYILDQLKIESEKESQFMIGSDSTSIDGSKSDVELLKDAYSVAKILWNALNVLDHCRTSELIKNVPNYVVPFYIANYLVNDAGLVLNPKDVYCNDIKCLRPPITITSEAEALAKRICFEKQLSSNSILHSIVGVRYPATGMSSLLSLSTTSSPHHSYHTWQAVNLNKLKSSSCNVIASVRVQQPATSIMGRRSQFPSSSMSNSPHRTFHIGQAVKTMGLRLSKTTQIKQSFHNVLLASRACAPLIWNFKKIIK